MFASFLITLREGLEAFLLIGICISYLDKLDARRFHRYIYVGVALGLVASLVLAFIFQVMVDQFHNQHYRNLVMAFILIFATLVLSSMAMWMQKQGGKKSGQMKENLSKLVDGEKALGLAFLAFLAIVREGFETVLFFSALVYSGQGVTLQSGMSGALAGLAIALAMVWGLMRSTRQVPLKPFFRWSSLLVVIIAAGLFSSAVNMLQAANWLPVLLSPLFDISFILDDRGLVGTFLRALFGYNSSPGLLQLLAWASYLLVFGYLWKRQYAQ